MLSILGTIASIIMLIAFIVWYLGLLCASVLGYKIIKEFKKYEKKMEDDKNE